jgi:hypothetical protein
MTQSQTSGFSESPRGKVARTTATNDTKGIINGEPFCNPRRVEFELW